jgi:5-methylthioadenosine/S-adenosylhomocysteine deaminase
MQEADLIVRRALVVTQDAARRVIENGAVVVRGAQIVAVGSTTEIDLQWHAANVIDAAGQALFPGLVNVHTHLFQSAVKGMGEDLPLEKWVQAVTIPTATTMNPDELYLLAMVSCLENLRSGATTVQEFTYPLPDPALHEAQLQALIDSGLRARYGRSINDTGETIGVRPAIIEPAEKTLAHVVELQRRYGGAANGRIDVGIAIGVIWGMTPAGLRAARQTASHHGLPLTMHVNETPFDNYNTLERTGLDTVALLEQCGVLGPDLLAVHCVYMTPDEIALFGERGVSVAYNAIANMYLGSGIPPILAMESAGVPIAIASDGSGSNNCQDMIEVMKISALLQKVAALDAGAVRSQHAFDWATLGGAKALGLHGQIGSLEAGKQADFFLLNAYSPKATPVHDPVATLVYSSGQDDVKSVVVAGRLLMHEGRLLHVDEIGLLHRAQEAAERLAHRSGTEQLLLARTRWRPAGNPTLLPSNAD